MQDALLVLVLLASSSQIASGACSGDDDATFGGIIEPMVGQRLTCHEMILQQEQGQVCDDPGLAQVCCVSCEQLVAKKKEDLAKLTPRKDAVRRLLQQSDRRLRSPPLHGRGAGMPLIAVGTGGLTGQSGQDIMQFALEAGMVHIDSAIMYGNHDAVFGAVQASGLPREQLFITTKVPPEKMGYRLATQALSKIEKDMPGNYADLCLVHWPVTGHWGEAKPEGATDSNPPAQWSIIERAGTWRAFEEAYDRGVCRAIGVSNYLVAHLEELRAYARIQPSVNQLEFSPLAPIQNVKEYCREHGIVLQAFSWRNNAVLDSPGVKEVASQLGKSPSQVVQRWFMQQGMSPLFMTRKHERLLSTAEDMAADFLMTDEQLLTVLQPSERYLDYDWKHYNGDNRVWLQATMGVQVDAAGKEDCFTGSDFNNDVCCHSRHGPTGNPACWDFKYTYDVCC